MDTWLVIALGAFCYLSGRWHRSLLHAEEVTRLESLVRDLEDEASALEEESWQKTQRMRQMGLDHASVLHRALAGEEISVLDRAA
jgi:hypothetical protein